MSDEQIIWEDSLLIKAYDDSINLARETLARRIADSTNTREANEAEKTEAASTSDQDLEPQEDVEEQEQVFKVGDFARATYTDGLDYEGTVMFINEKAGTCVLRYVGYENEQEVLLIDLLPSWGSKVRREQILQAKRAEAEEAQPQQRAKTSKKSGSKSKASPGLVMPPMPLVPPMFTPSGAMGGGEPEQDFVAMLTAWYMSGYYTGLYQGRKESSSKKKTSKK